MTISFQSLGLSEACVEQLTSIGFETPTDIQAQAIPHILLGRDIVGQSQTGTGKTAAYSLPILEHMDSDITDVQALILTPTRELAQQVAKSITTFTTSRRMRVLTICGGQSIERQIRSLNRGVQIVVGTPGRVIDLLERGALQLYELRWAVLDEADEMLSMGFIDDVKKILRQAPPEHKTACFSATMPREIRDLIQNFMDSPATVAIKQPETTPNRIEQRVYFLPRSWSKINALQPILAMENPERGIIFVRTKRAAGEITSQLQGSGLNVDEYHGDLSQGQRERLVQRFRDGKIQLVVATDIAARGLDVQDLSHVINYDLPDNPETYIHRIGRTGRAGRTGTAISLVQPSDRYLLRRIERSLRQSLEVSKIPSRAQVEAHRITQMKDKLQATLSGERMASFLPIVKELSEEYDAHAIAAAALQMVYDQSCPSWMEKDWDVPSGDFSKPIKRNNKPRRRNHNNYDRDDRRPRTGDRNNWSSRRKRIHAGD
ncbi:MAG: DEAD/DEAH box helicase [Spirulina sp. SIO3F2]|nr:DEAD/DEAH box helicase [Spirulina sp. SIO3F2]